MDMEKSKEKSSQPPAKTPENTSAVEKTLRQGYENVVDKVKRSLDETKAALEASAHDMGEMEVMIKKMKDMQTDLDAKINEMRREAASHNIDIEKLMETASPLTKKDKELLRTMEDKLKNRIDEALPTESQLRPLQKTKEQLTKERLAKTRGDRKKWLPMR